MAQQRQHQSHVSWCYIDYIHNVRSRTEYTNRWGASGLISCPVQCYDSRAGSVQLQPAGCIVVSLVIQTIIRVFFGEET